MPRKYQSCFLLLCFATFAVKSHAIFPQTTKKFCESVTPPKILTMDEASIKQLQENQPEEYEKLIQGIKDYIKDLEKQQQIINEEIKQHVTKVTEHRYTQLYTYMSELESNPTDQATESFAEKVKKLQEDINALEQYKAMVQQTANKQFAEVDRICTDKIAEANEKLRQLTGEDIDEDEEDKKGEYCGTIDKPKANEQYNKEKISNYISNLQEQLDKITEKIDEQVKEAGDIAYKEALEQAQKEGLTSPRSEAASARSEAENNKKAELEEYYKSHIESCERRIKNAEEMKETSKTCNEKLEKLRESQSKFRKDCSNFASGRMQCAMAIIACSSCRADGSGDSQDFDCVRIKGKTSCPAHSAEDLKAAQERAKELGDEQKELNDDIHEQTKDLDQETQKLREAIAELDQEFSDQISELERKTKEAKRGIEQTMQELIAKGQEEVAKALREVQAELDQTLALGHEFENAITEAEMNYRKEKRQIVAECETQARSRLAEFRTRRRQAITTGSLQITLTDFLTKGRKNFATVDANNFKVYYAQCLNRRRGDFRIAYEMFQKHLRRIEQKKEQYQHRLNILRRDMNHLHDQLTKSERQIVEQYTKQLQEVIQESQTLYAAYKKRYIEQKNLLLQQTQTLDIMERRLTQNKFLLRDKHLQQVREDELIGYLEAKGVPTEDASSDFADAAGSFSEYHSTVEIAAGTCKEHDVVKQAKKHLIQHGGGAENLEDFFGGSYGDR